MWMHTIFLCILLAVYSQTSKICYEKHSCKLEQLGCFDDRYQRALPELLLNERDVVSKKYAGKTIDWNNFSEYIKGFGCRCARIATEKGYNVIGLQFYGECWSGPNGESTYDIYGRSTNCVNGKFRSISNSSNCVEFVGASWTNHVYRIATPGCKDQFEPVGCFHDNLVEPRPVPNYIMNERDYTNKGWNGRLIDWENWITYSPAMICRCARAARRKKQDYFAIQFWGECWSGKISEINYNRNGLSTNCSNEHRKKCTCNSYNCVGKAWTNYVYKLNAIVPCTR